MFCGLLRVLCSEREERVLTGEEAGFNRVRITGQLIDAVGAYHIWAERYDRSIEDVFAVQDEIADAIVTALEPAVGRAEMQRAQRKNPENLDAWDLYQQGMWFLSKTTREDTEQARALFRQSAAEDPNFAAPFAGLGLLGFLEVSLGYTANPAQAMGTARVSAATSVRLDELDPLAQVALGYASSWNREYDAGVTAARRAVELNHYEAGVQLERVAGITNHRETLPLRLTRLKAHCHFGNTGRHIETARAFDTDWLQSNRVCRATDQHVGADPNTDRRGCRHSAIRSGQRSRCEIDGRCNYRPDQYATLEITDVDAEFVDRSDIMLGRSIWG